MWQEFWFNSSFDLSFTSNINCGLNIFSKPFSFYDYYEPRVWGQKYKHIGFLYGSIYASTNSNKPVFVSANIGYGESKNPDDPYIDGGIDPYFVLNDHVQIGLHSNFSINNKDYGFADFDSKGNIIYGQRNLYDLTNGISFQYNVNSKMNLKFTARDYYFKVQYTNFYFLNADGSLTQNNYSGDYDLNVNLFNIDCVYSWQIAPGSYLNLIWKNNISHLDNRSVESYLNNLNRTMKEPQSNMLSLKLIYYLDYSSIFNQQKG